MKKTTFAFGVLSLLLLWACKDNNQSADGGLFPALKVDFAEIINCNDSLKNPFPMSEKEEDNFYREIYRDSAFLGFYANFPQTGYFWVDTVLYNGLLCNAYYVIPDSLCSYQWNSEKDFYKNGIDSLKRHFEQARVTELRDTFFYMDYGRDYRHIFEYLGQRGQLVTFSLYSYSYTGGAHGSYNTEYFVFDGKKKKRLTLEDIVLDGDLSVLAKPLWRVNRERSEETSSYLEIDENEYKGFEVVKNFYIDSKGIHVVYGTYQIASFAEGEIDLTLSWEVANPLIRPEYRENAVKYSGNF